MISAIVSIYNVEDYLPRCLESIVSQTYKDLEIILVDDGSTDGSGRICEEYALSDNRIKVIHTENGGLSSSRNCGLRAASGDYVLMPDGDDALHPRMIEILYNLIISGEYDFAMCLGEDVYDVNLVLNRYNNSIDESKARVVNQDICIKNLLLEGNTQYVAAWNKLYKRDFIQDTYFANTPSEDLEFNNRCFLRMNKAIFIESVMYYWIQRPSSISRQGINQRWVNIPNSWLLSLEAIPSNNKLYRSYCLRRIYKHLLSTRLWSRKSPYHSSAVKIVKSIRKSTIREYIFNRYIPFFEKIVIIVFLYCPFLYRLFMAIMEYRAKRSKLLCFIFI